jgi:hypothetical protein
MFRVQNTGLHNMVNFTATHFTVIRNQFKEMKIHEGFENNQQCKFNRLYILKITIPVDNTINFNHTDFKILCIYFTYALKRPCLSVNIKVNRNIFPCLHSSGIVINLIFHCFLCTVSNILSTCVIHNEIYIEHTAL